MLTTKEPVKDLGRLKYGRPSTFYLPIKNESSAPAEIEKLIVGCGSCTKATVSKTMLGPNEEIQISVTFTPGSTGSQKKYVSIKYQGDSILKLEFTADVYA